MPRQTSIQATEATKRQADELKQLGFGTFTDVVRIAIDRMYQYEIRSKSMKHILYLETADGRAVRVPGNSDEQIEIVEWPDPIQADMTNTLKASVMAEARDVAKSGGTKLAHPERVGVRHTQ